MRSFFLFAALLLAAFGAIAESPSPCAADQQRHCAETAPGPDLVRCLAKNESQLEANCREDLQRQRGLLKQASGMGAVGGRGGMPGGLGLVAPPMPLFVYGGTITPGTTPTLFESHRLSASMPVWREGPHTWTMSLSSEASHIGEDAVLSDFGTPVPSNLYRFDVGAQYSRALEGEKLLGARFSIGSAGDRPPSDAKKPTYGLNGFYLFPGESGHLWAFTVFMSNNNPIVNNIPLPGFLYVYRSDRVTGLIGIPFAALQWTPVDPWSLSISLFGPTLQTEAAYGSRRELQLFANASVAVQSYLREDRTEEDDRLYLSEQKTAIGARLPLHRRLSAEMQGGHASHRKIFEGRRFNSADRGSADLRSSWFLSWNLNLMFF